MAHQIGKQEGTKAKPNYLYSIISVALVLFLLGIFGLFMIHAQGVINHYKETVEIIVELKDDAAENEIFQFQKRLEGSSFTKLGSVKYVSKEDAAAIIREDFGEDEFMQFGLNPLYNTLNFNVNSAYMNPDSLKVISENIKTEGFVSDVFYHKPLVESMSRNINRISIFVLILSGILILIAVSLIHNTIRLALYSNRFLIKNMQLVGASWGFISRPYIMTGIRNGLISGVIAMGGVALVNFFVQREIEHLNILNHLLSFSILAIFIIALGILMSGASTYFSVNKYLKMRLDDLY